MIVRLIPRGWAPYQEKTWSLTAVLLTPEVELVTVKGFREYPDYAAGRLVVWRAEKSPGRPVSRNRRTALYWMQ